MSENEDIYLKKDIEEKPFDFFNEAYTQGKEGSHDFKRLARFYKVHIILFTVLQERKLFSFQKAKIEYGKKHSTTARLIHIQGRWLLALKQNLLLLFFCNVCSRWRRGKSYKDFKALHIKNCRRCDCGEVYDKEDSHYLTCTKRRRKKQKKTDSKKYKLDTGTEKKLFRNVHHADFECHREGQDLNFIVNTAVLLKAGSKEPKVRCGKDALSWFMKSILKLEGVLWFFNGGRFDLYFVLKYCMENGITIDNRNSLICRNQIMTLGLFTRPKNSKKIKSLVFKDLAKFCPGSLDYNCKTLGIETSACKGTFDHSLIKSWDDVLKHQKEYVAYAKLDVIAQERVYAETAKFLWNDYKLNMCKFISLPQLSYAASTTFMPDNVLYNVSRIDFFGNETGFEEKLRNAYRGGRVLVTIPCWKHKSFDELVERIKKEPVTTREEIQRVVGPHKVYLDVVSLYPSVMWSQKYPCGKMTYHKNCGVLHDFYVEAILQEANIMKETTVSLESETGEAPFKYVCKPKQDYKFFWKYAVLCIDIDCPEEKMYVAFLMDRDENGRNLQNMKNKRKYWCTGVELLEAIIVGYKLKKIHEYFTWERTEYLFKEFISKAIARKAAAKRDTAPYTFSKNIMNQNSGKWAQETIDSSITVYGAKDLTPEMLMARASEGDCVYDDDGMIVGKFVKTKHIPETSPYPMHISVFVLGYSKEKMSQFLRLIKGYTKKEYVPTYGDTDSLFADSESLKGLSKEELGDSLGQMKDENPGNPYIAQITLGPKTRFDMWIEVNEKDSKARLFGKFTSKGIPHIRSQYDPYGNYLVSEEKKNKVLEIINFINTRENTKTKYPEVNLGEYYYYKTYHDRDDYEIKDRITWPDMEDLIHERATILSIFGGMVRVLTQVEHIEQMGVNMDYSKRCIINNLWWKQGFRVFNPETHPNSLTDLVYD